MGCSCDVEAPESDAFYYLIFFRFENSPPLLSSPGLSPSLHFIWLFAEGLR